MPSSYRAAGSLQGHVHVCVSGAKQGAQSCKKEQSPGIACLGNLHREVEFARVLQCMQVERMKGEPKMCLGGRGETKLAEASCQ